MILGSALASVASFLAIIESGYISALEFDFLCSLSFDLAYFLDSYSFYIDIIIGFLLNAAFTSQRVLLLALFLWPMD